MSKLPPMSKSKKQIDRTRNFIQCRHEREEDEGEDTAEDEDGEKGGWVVDGAREEEWSTCITKVGMRLGLNFSSLLLFFPNMLDEDDAE